MPLDLAYHFVSNALRDGRPVPADGEVLRHEGKLELCNWGLHFSRHPFDALKYAPGATARSCRHTASECPSGGSPWPGGLGTGSRRAPKRSGIAGRPSGIRRERVGPGARRHRMTAKTRHSLSAHNTSRQEGRQRREVSHAVHRLRSNGEGPVQQHLSRKRPRRKQYFRNDPSCPASRAFATSDRTRGESVNVKDDHQVFADYVAGLTDAEVVLLLKRARKRLEVLSTLAPSRVGAAAPQVEAAHTPRAARS